MDEVTLVRRSENPLIRWGLRLGAGLVGLATLAGCGGGGSVEAADAGTTESTATSLDTTATTITTETSAPPVEGGSFDPDCPTVDGVVDLVLDMDIKTVDEPVVEGLSVRELMYSPSGCVDPNMVVFAVEQVMRSRIDTNPEVLAIATGTDFTDAMDPEEKAGYIALACSQMAVDRPGVDPQTTMMNLAQRLNMDPGSPETMAQLAPLIRAAREVCGDIPQGQYSSGWEIP